MIKHFEDWNGLFAEVAKHKQIKFSMESPLGKNLVIDFDVDKMERIYTNLLSNSFKFTPEKGTIQVRIERGFIDQKDAVKVQVLNSGKSIPENKIKEIFDTPDQALNPEKSFIEKLEEQIEKHIENPELSVDFLSNELGMSRIQLYRKVKALTNYSPVEFITLFRLKKAVNLMKMTDTNLAQIAYQVGFSAPSYFSKSFKKYYGKSPSEYLKEIRNI